MSTFSVVCGTRACNANCPFCISKMTTACTDSDKLNFPDFSWMRFNRAIEYVKREGVHTAIITGRGEPTLFPKILDEILMSLGNDFHIELQTNGTALATMDDDCLAWLFEDNITTVSISVCNTDPQYNNDIMGITAKYNYVELISRLKKAGFTVRVSYMLLNMTNQGIVVPRTCEDFVILTDKLKSYGADQITFRKIGFPENTKENEAVYRWIKENADQTNYVPAFDMLVASGKAARLQSFDWGGVVYDLNGASVCLADCMTDKTQSNKPRSFIFDGNHLRYSWQYKGALIF